MGGEKGKNYFSSEVDQFKDNAVPQKNIFLLQMSATSSNFCETFCSTEWFQQQQESTNEIENLAEKPKWGERK